jgi:hypothetical protein
MEEQARDGFPQPAERRAARDQGFEIGLDLIITGIRAKPATNETETKSPPKRSSARRSPA